MKLESSIEEGIEAIVTEKGFDCYEVKYFNAGGKTILRVFADSDNGISMDDCAAISRALSEMLDEQDFGKTEYTLEVSSPGLDRPLKNERDFRRFTGKMVQVRYRNEKGNQRKFAGEVVATDENQVTLKNEEGEEAFRYEELLNGKVVL